MSCSWQSSLGWTNNYSLIQNGASSYYCNVLRAWCFWHLVFNVVSWIKTASFTKIVLFFTETTTIHTEKAIKTDSFLNTHSACSYRERGEKWYNTRGWLITAWDTVSFDPRPHCTVWHKQHATPYRTRSKGSHHYKLHEWKQAVRMRCCYTSFNQPKLEFHITQ